MLHCAVGQVFSGVLTNGCVGVHYCAVGQVFSGVLTSGCVGVCFSDWTVSARPVVKTSTLRVKGRGSNPPCNRIFLG